MNKRLDNILYIIGLVLVGILLIFVTNVFAKPPRPTIYDKKQDNKIQDNRDDINVNWNRSVNNENDIVSNLDKINNIDIGKNLGLIEDNTDEIVRVEDKSKDRDNKLSKRIINNKDNISINKKKIINVDDKHTSCNKRQDKTLNDHNKRITDNSDRINDLDSRVGDLEKTQYKVQVEFRVLDTKRLTISPYISQNFTRNCIDEAGVRITIKLGASYEEKEIVKTNARLSVIEEKLAIMPVLEKVVDTKGNTKSLRIIGNGLAVGGQF